MVSESLQELDDAEFLKVVVGVGLEFKRRFDLDLGITGAYGEVHSAIVWDMQRSTRVQQEGFDSTISGSRVQIKCGVNRAATDTCSEFSMHDFDHFVYVHYDDKFNITEAYLLSKEQVSNLLDGRVKGKRKLRLSQIRKYGKRVMPGEKLPIAAVALSAE